MTYRRVVPRFTIPNLLYHSLFTIPLFVLFALLCTTGAVAQNESGVRFLAPGRFTHSGYDSTKHWFMKQFPIIRSLPPLNSGMSREVMAAYIHLDSLARFNNNGDLVQRVTQEAAWLAQPELLKKTIAALYLATDYNPVIFQQYDFETGLKSGSVKKYTTPLGLFTDHFPDILARAASVPREGWALKSALAPAYVLRVKVVGIDSVQMIDRVPNPTGNEPYLYSVRAQILDTLKGRIIPYGEPAHPVIPYNVRFQYYRDYYVTVSSQFDRMPEHDSAFMMSYPQGAHGFTMRTGQEAIVFLSHSAWKLDSMYDYFNLSLDPEAFYALPVIDGQVRDVNRWWSDNLLMPYADWHRRFMEIREKLVSGTYLSGTN